MCLIFVVESLNPFNVCTPHMCVSACVSEWIILNYCYERWSKNTTSKRRRRRQRQQKYSDANTKFYVKYLLFMGGYLAIFIFINFKASHQPQLCSWWTVYLAFLSLQALARLWCISNIRPLLSKIKDMLTVEKVYLQQSARISIESRGFLLFVTASLSLLLLWLLWLLLLRLLLSFSIKKNIRRNSVYNNASWPYNHLNLHRILIPFLKPQNWWIFNDTLNLSEP